MADFYVRGLNGILIGNTVKQQYTEVASPFLNLDFLQFCLSIPLEKRAYHGIYKKWILAKYPEAAKFKWEAIDAKISDKSIRYRGKVIPVRALPKFIIEGVFYKLGMPINGINSKNNMNPYKYWLKTNQSLKQHFDKYFNDYLDVIRDTELKKDSEKLYKTGNAVSKMQVLSLL